MHEIVDARDTMGESNARMEMFRQKCCVSSTITCTGSYAARRLTSGEKNMGSSIHLNAFALALGLCKVIAERLYRFFAGREKVEGMHVGVGLSLSADAFDDWQR